MHKGFDVQPTGKLVPVGAVQIPSVFTAVFTDDDAGGPDVSLRFEIRDGAPSCQEVHLVATADGHEVRQSGIVGVRVANVLDQALRHMLVGAGDVSPAGLHRWYDLLPPESVRESQRARSAQRSTITDSLLREVAEIYRSAVHTRKPTEAVEEHFDVAHRTAAKYVQRARGAGYLPPTTRGKAQT